MTPVSSLARASLPSPYSPNLNNWLQDEETGFLYIPPNARGSVNPFTVEKKKEFIVQYAAQYPELNDVLDQVGISKTTFYWHLKLDAAFREAIQDVRDRKLDKLESTMYKNGLRPSGFMDRIAMLRAHRPDIWTEKRISLTARDLEPSAAVLKVQNLSTAIDTEMLGDQAPRPQLPETIGPIPGTGTLVPEPLNQDKAKENGNPG